MALVDLDKLKGQGRRFADGFTNGQKAVTIAAIVGVVMAMFMFSKWESKAVYAPLFTSLDSKSAGTVTQALDSKGIKYQLTDGGATVLVPKSQVYKVRADLSTQNIPAASSDGWSIMDKGGITKDEFSKRVDYQRALQIELSKTIMAIDGVQSATVNLTIPQQSVFVASTDSQATAAVLVTPMTSTALSTEKVQAIVNLVSSSVPNLSPDKVTVADSLGNVLSAPGQSGSLVNSQNLDAKNAFDTNLAAKIQTMIATSLGAGHAAITVNSDLNFDHQTSKEDKYATPGGKKGKQIPLNSSTKSEKFTGPGTQSAGVLGPTISPVANGANATNYNNTTTDANWAVDQVHKEITAAPGTIKQLSVSAILDSSKVTQADISKWTQIIAGAAGITAKRGDALAVNLVPFDTTAAKAQAAQAKTYTGAQSKDFLLNLVRYLVTLLIVAFVLFLAWRAVKRSAAISSPVRVPLDLRELEAGDLVGNRLDSGTYEGANQLADGGRGRMQIESSRSAFEDDLNELIERQPDEVAQTLRSWLADRRT
ncbi:MAG: flagellar M-ring protein FliF [Actinomycetia bacterium]|nr:flagellar M-ring protein FliF [Actinomycetes bacterium]